MELRAHSLSLPGRLNDVSMMARAGELTAIVGPNGAGKSSLLTCLAGLRAPATGAVMLGDENLATLPPRARAQRIGYLAQSPEIAWDVTVETLVSLGRLPWQASTFRRKTPSAAEDRDAVENALANMELLTLRSRQLSQLSGGERARALAARVLAGNPDWIFADEPLANLDLAHAFTLIRHLHRESRDGRGVVIVLHDLAAAMNHADRVIVLDRGRVVADGPPETALTSELVTRVWQSPVQWLGEPGHRALVISAENLPRSKAY